MNDTSFVGDNDHGDAVPISQTEVVEQITRHRDSLYSEVCMLYSRNDELRRERDEARRWVCVMKAMSVTYAYPPEHFAREHGWDCFEGMPKPWSHGDKMQSLHRGLEQARQRQFVESPQLGGLDQEDANFNNEMHRRTDGES